MKERRHRHGHVFWRVYLHGLLLLCLVGITVAGVGFALRRGGGAEEPGRVAAYAADRIAELAGTPERLTDELRRVRDVFGIDATIYGADGRMLATNVEPPLAAHGGAPSRAGPVPLRDRGLGWSVPLRALHGHLVLSSEARGHDPHRALLFIGAVLVVLALGSFPLARSIAAPVERLTAAARALGAGDLSARAHVHAKGELGELGRAFDEMAERLQRLVESERELLANVSHELRTPLARIRVALELAAEGDPERARQHLAGIASDLAELDGLIEDVLTAARLDARGAGDLPLSPAPVELAGVVAEAAARFREVHPDRELVVEADHAPNVKGDAALLRRLLSNLLDNAAKYSEAPSPVTLALRAEGAAAVLEVRDRGIGFDPADLPRLFTPFFRTDRSRARGTGGTGLGLALAKRIAEAHGGAIAAESAPGQGAVFRVRLPAHAPSASGGAAG
ncbi:MAG TPA: HAMP domain-containing sensor histidine kinase [Anaeromyxobacter sp.]